MTTKSDIRGWLESGKERNARYMIVVCDTFDYEDYPVYVLPGESLEDRAREYDGVNMQRIMEIYNLSMDWDEQLNTRRAFNRETLRDILMRQAEREI